jgi:hypothetical protein
MPVQTRSQVKAVAVVDTVIPARSQYTIRTRSQAKNDATLTVQEPATPVAKRIAKSRPSRLELFIPHFENLYEECLRSQKMLKVSKFRYEIYHMSTIQSLFEFINFSVEDSETLKTYIQSEIKNKIVTLARETLENIQVSKREFPLAKKELLTTIRLLSDDNVVPVVPVEPEPVEPVEHPVITRMHTCIDSLITSNKLGKFINTTKAMLTLFKEMKNTKNFTTNNQIVMVAQIYSEINKSLEDKSLRESIPSQLRELIMSNVKMNLNEITNRTDKNSLLLKKILHNTVRLFLGGV